MNFTFVDDKLSVLHSNKYIHNIVSMALVLYAGLAKPTLPAIIKDLFENGVFRIVVLSIVLYRGNKDPQFSILVATAFTLILNRLGEQKIKENFGLL